MDCIKLPELGELDFFLGLQKKQKKDGIFISRDKYVTEILKKFGFTDVKIASTPMETQKALVKDKDVCACARYHVNPKVSHLHAVKRIFRYLKGQPKLGLWYPKDLPFDLVAYTNSDYVGASLDRKSTIGGCQFFWLVPSCRVIFDLEPLSLSFGFFEHEHVVMNPISAGMGYRHHRITCRIHMNLLDRVSQLHWPFSLSKRLKVDNMDFHLHGEYLSITRMFWQNHKDNAYKSC
ncbi:hypothetical protein Tco_1397050 [Tanacetum coccineum]